MTQTVNSTKYLAEKIKQNAFDYFIPYTYQPDQLAEKLKSIKEENGKSVFLDFDLLQSAMKKQSISSIDICKILMLSQIDGYRSLVASDEKIETSHLNRFILQSMNDTALSRTEIIRLTNALAYALGFANNLKEQSHAGGFCNEENEAYYIPRNYYRDILDRFSREVQNALSQRSRSAKNSSSQNQSSGNISASDEDYPNLNLTEITCLVRMNVPEALYLYGYAGLQQLIADFDQNHAIEMLEKAADLGSLKAAELLGNFYFEKGSKTWKQSLDYYTGLGRDNRSKNNHSRIHILQMLNQKNLNKRLLIKGSISWLVLGILFWLLPSFGIDGQLKVWFWSGWVIGWVVLLLTYLLKAKNPYRIYAWSIVWLYGILIVSLAAGILF